MVVLHFSEIYALIVHAALQGQSRSLRLGLGEVMVTIDVNDRFAIRDDIPLEPPFSPQLVLQEQSVGTGGLPVDAVVGAHDRVGFALGHSGAECGEICVQLIARLTSTFTVWRVGSGPCALRNASASQ